MTYPPHTYTDDPYGTVALSQGPAGGYAHVGSTPPVAANVGDFWWRTSDTNDDATTIGLYTFYHSGTGLQWIEMTNGVISAQRSLTTEQADLLYLQLVGGTMTGPLVLDDDPTEKLEAATKQYVDSVSSTGPKQDPIDQQTQYAHNFIVKQMTSLTPYKTLAMELDQAYFGFAGDLNMFWEEHEVALTTCPIQITAPQYWPLKSGEPADIYGSVITPFRSTEGPAGADGTPVNDWASPNNRIGSYFVRGSVNNVVQFEVKVGGNGYFNVHLNTVPSGSWTFQLVTYPTSAKTESNNVGLPWLSLDHPGSVTEYLIEKMPRKGTRFSNVTIAPDRVSATVDLTDVPYGEYSNLRCYVSVETDVEYAWAILPLVSGVVNAAVTPFSAGDVKLRLMRVGGQSKKCLVEDYGGVWSQQTSASTGWHGLRLEVRDTSVIDPYAPDAIMTLDYNGHVVVPVLGNEFLSLRIVDINTMRLMGETYMNSGLARSYNVSPQNAGQTFDSGNVYYDAFNFTSFIYDQGVALIALIQLKDWTNAQRLMTAIINCQNPDGSWSFAVSQKSPKQAPTGFIRNGASAWALYGLLIARQWDNLKFFNAAGLDLAIDRAFAYFEQYKNGINLVRGGTGAYDTSGNLNPSYVIPWWSMEHNIDLWFCYNMAGVIYNNPAHTTRANEIRSAIMTFGVDTAKNILWQGGGHTGNNDTDPPSYATDIISDGCHALDTHSWGSAMLWHWQEYSLAGNSMARAEEKYLITERPATGYTTVIPEDGGPPDTVKTIWFEGSYGVARAYNIMGQYNMGDYVNSRLIGYQNADGSFPYVVTADPANGLITWPCIIAPAWAIIAGSHDSPCWRLI